MQRKLTSITGIIIIAVIVLAVNLMASLLLPRMKVDMTEENLYTLSTGSRKILNQLDTKIDGTYYYSRKALAENPMLKGYAERVRQFLREFVAASNGKFSFEIIDPRPDTQEEEWAVRYGLKSVPGQEGEPIYMGLVLKDETGREQVIPFFNPRDEQTLEYDIAKAFYSLANPEKKKIGVMSSLDVMGGPQPNPMMMQQQQQPQRAWMFIRRLKNNFDVEEVDTTATEIPQDLDLLLVIHPQGISDATQYAIDQYVLGGGRALVFVDPFSEVQAMQSQNPQMRMQQSYNSDMPKLLKAWGVELQGPTSKDEQQNMMGMENEANIVADPNLAVQVQNPQTGDLQKMLVYLKLGPDNRNGSEIITSQLENLLMASAGSLKATPPSDDVTITPLFTTTDKAGTIGSMIMKFGADPQQIEKQYKSGDKQLTLAARVSGVFKTAFPDGKPGAESEEDEKGEEATVKTPDQLTQSKTESTVIVVADTDMISDPFSVRTSNFFGQELVEAINENLFFASNAAEFLTGSRALISLRSRGQMQRPFTKVQEIQRSAQEKWKSEEDRLQKKLEEANQRLRQLQQGGDEDKILDQAYLQEIDKLRSEKVKTQESLREVRRHLRENIESLGFKLKFINIALIPLLVVCVSIIVAIVKAVRRRRLTARAASR